MRYSLEICKYKTNIFNPIGPESNPGLIFYSAGPITFSHPSRAPCPGGGVGANVIGVLTGACRQTDKTHVVVLGNA